MFERVVSLGVNWLAGRWLSALKWTAIVLVASTVGVKAYTALRDHIVNLDNMRVELANERILRERAEASLTAVQAAQAAQENARKAMAALRADFAKETQETRRQMDEMADLLLDRERLNRLSVAKPGLMQDRMNKATEKVFRELEDDINGDPRR